MRVDIITLFPDFFESFKTHSIIGRAIGSGKVELVIHNLRDWAHDSYGTVDDRPYGGGVGMVLRVDVLASCLTDVVKMSEAPKDKTKVILLTPQGLVYKQKVARELTSYDRLILICGHYEGFDERIREYVDLEISVGDYVLTGGEIPSMILVDSVARLLPGVLGDDKSSQDESFSEGTLEYPQYTRPPEYDGKSVPEILLGGNHPLIEEWRKKQAIERTKVKRPDLISQKSET